MPLDINNNKFEKDFNLTKQNGTKIILNTGGYFVDKDIYLTINAREAQVSLPTATATASINKLNYNYNSETGKFDVTGNGNITGSHNLTVTQTGWINTAPEAGTITGTASITNTAINKIVVGASFSTTNGKVTPLINKITTNTNAQSGDVTTSRPNSGFYIAVQSGASSKTISTSGNVTEEGYGTPTNFTKATASTLAIGANESDITYIPIQAGSVGIASAEGTINLNPLTYTYSADNGYFIGTTTGTITGTAIPSVTEGYVTSGANGDITGDITYTNNLNKINLKATLSGQTTLLKPTLVTDTTASTTNAKNITSTTATTTKPSNGFYISIKSEEKKAQIKATPSVQTAGYGAPATGQYSVHSEGSAYVGAAASDIHYIPIPSGEITISGGNLTKGITTSSISASSGYYNGTNYDTNDSIILSETETSGYYKLVTSGTARVHRAAIKKQVTSAGWFDNNDNAVDTNLTQTYIDITNDTKSYWIPKSTLSTSTLTSSNSKQTVTITAGYYPTERTITINAMTARTPTTAYSNTGMSTYFTAGTSSDKDVTITPQYTLANAGYVAAQTTAKNNGGTGYWKIKTTTMSKTSSSNSGTTTTRGTASWGTGWITEGTIAAATFANTATSNVNYLDISNTTASPILISGDYLYINEGYVDNLKISLKKLVPDNATITINTDSSKSDQILSGYAAYNSDGTLVSGSIPTKTQNDISVSGKTVTIPAGYYASPYTKNVADGVYNADSINKNNSAITPAISITTTTVDYGFTTSQPASGSVGTNYLMISPSATATAWSVTPQANITTAGYIAKGNKTGTTVTDTPSINSGVNYYIPITSVTFSGGSVTKTNYVGKPIITLSNGSDTNLTSNSYEMLTAKDTTNYPYYFKINANTGELTGTTNVTVAKRTYSVGKGIIAAVNGGSALGKINQSPSVTVNAADQKSIYIGLKQATSSITNGTATATATAGVASIVTNPSATASASATPTGMDGGYYTDTTTSSYYITINASATSKSGVVEATGGSASASVTASTVTLGVGYNPDSVTASTGESSTGNKTGNYIKTQEATQTKTINTKIYLKPATIASEGSVTTAPSVAIGGTNTMAVSTTETPYYFTRTGTITNGKVQTKYKVTQAGYTPTKGATNSGTVSVVPTKTDDATVYIKEAVITGSCTNAAGAVTVAPGTVSIAAGTDVSGKTKVAITPTTDTSKISTYYIPIKATAAANSTGTTNSISGTGTISVSTAGYAPSTLAGTVTVSGTATGKTSQKTSSNYVIPLPTAAATISGTATASSPTVARTDTTATNATNVGNGTATTTAPESGYFVAVQATAPATTVNLTKTINTVGYIDSNTQITASANTSATTGSVYYITVPTGSCTVAGGVLSTTGYEKTNLALTLQSGSDTNMGNITAGSKNTSTYPYYFKINGSTPAVSGTTSASVTAITDAHTAGYIPQKNTTNFRDQQTANPTVKVNATTNDIYVNLKQATANISGSNVVTPSVSLTSTNISYSDTDNGIKVIATGGGTASVTAVAKTNAVGYSGSANTQLGSQKLDAPSKTTTSNKFISRVKLVPPSTGTRSFEIEVPNGSTTDYIVFRFTVDTSGNVWVDGP